MKVAAGAISFLTTLILVPGVIRLCSRWRLYDSTGPLKIHSQPIPRLGGVAIVVGLAAGPLAVNYFLQTRAWPFWIALALIWTTGFLDDIRGVSPILRLVAQIGAGSLLWYGGWRLPLSGVGTFGLVAVCFFVVLFSNASNFLDGSDGLCAGVAGVIALAYAALPGAVLGSVGFAVAWSLLGASAGFLVANFPPALIFMGDSGSTVLGFTVAFLALDFYRANATRLSPSIFFFPILLASIPLLDAVLVILRRLRNGQSVLKGDRLHFYDLLRASGWSSRRVALTCYWLTAVLCLVARLGLQSEITYVFSLYVLSVAALLLAAVRLGLLKSKDSPPRVERART
jgi:UDP-GlcNAc:undecaprenyl-phosphate/decaprenyl-phosphate GlcNAc-1-phosphate transferase